MKPLNKIFLLFLLVLPQFSCLNACGAQSSDGTRSFFRSGVVASAHPLASQIGLKVLENGGNAIDAAVATAFALGVAEPFASGVGGGGFMMIYSAGTGEVVTVDYREKAPAGANVWMYQMTGNEQQIVGYRSVAVPGMVAGLALALEKYGTMNLAPLLLPAIQLAENGFPVTPLLNSMMAEHAPTLSMFPASANIFLKNGCPYAVGEWFRQQDLARTYRLLAQNGSKVFYQGTIARSIAEAMQQSGTGLITLADLKNYRAAFRPPVRGTYRGYEIISMGPPSSGGTHVIELLNILEGFDLAHIGLNSPQGIVIMAEAMKKVFADRATYMGDPDFVQIPLGKLLSKNYATDLRHSLPVGYASNQLNQSPPGPSESTQTSHLSIIDKDGNMVSLTETIDDFFGSGAVPPGSGIILNNAMRDFDLEPGGPNSIAPGKKPLSSMSPTLVLKDGKPFLSLGIPGATRIISVLPQILINVIDHHLTLQEAFNAPRIHCVTGPIYLESRIPDATKNALINLGYPVVVKKDFDLYFGGAQGVGVDPKTGLYYGAADPRREGSVAGY